MLVAGLLGAWVAQRHASLQLVPQGLQAWAMALLLAPALEEWALRSVALNSLYSFLQTRLGPHARWVANGLVSVVFVLLHLHTAGPMAWLWFFPSWALGMVWFRFRKWWACALTHAWFNAALVMFSLLAAPSAQAQSVEHVPQPACHMSPDALMSAQSDVPGMQLRASVHAEAGRLVLHAKQVLPNGQQVCMHNPHLLGPATGVLPTLAFHEGTLLSVRWQLPLEQTHGRQETYEMVFDAQQSGWPLVRYRHQLATLNTSSGVDADLQQHAATWTRLEPGNTQPRALTGPLKALPLQPLAQVPLFVDYAIQPKVRKIH